MGKYTPAVILVALSVIAPLIEVLFTEPELFLPTVLVLFGLPWLIWTVYSSIKDSKRQQHEAREQGKEPGEDLERLQTTEYETSYETARLHNEDEHVERQASGSIPQGAFIEKSDSNRLSEERKSSVVSFQEELKRNLRPKDEVAKEKAMLEYSKRMKTAEAELSAIKNRLIANAQKGEYTTVNGVTTVSCLHAIPHSFLCWEHKSNNEALARNAKRPALFQDHELQYREWWIFDISSAHWDEYNRYMEALEAVAAKENITLEVVVHFEKTNKVYKLPAIVSREDYYAHGYLCVRASTEIPSEPAKETNAQYASSVDGNVCAPKPQSSSIGMQQKGSAQNPGRVSGKFTFRACNIGSERGVEIQAAQMDENGVISIPEKIGMLNVVRIAENAFINSAVKQVILPETLIEIGEKAFYGCEQLREVDFPMSLRKIDERAFAHCNSLLNVQLPEGLETLGAFAFAYSGVERIQFPSTLNEIPYSCCAECNALVKIDIAEGISCIKEKAFSQLGMYKGKKVSNRLTHVRIPSSVIYLGDNAFENRDKTRIVISAVDAETSMNSEESFTSKDNALSIQKETKKAKNDQKLFAWMICTIGQQTGIEIVRWWNSEAEKIVVPEQYEGKPVLRIGDNAFKDHRIQRIILPTTLKEIGNSAFFGCKELSGIIIPPSVTSIGEKAFAQCSGMKKVVLSYGLEYLGVQAFSYSGVRKIKFPGTLRVIPSGCCFGCADLMKIRIDQGIVIIGKDAFRLDGRANRYGYGESEIVIPESVKTIEAGALINSNLQRFIFMGREELRMDDMDQFRSSLGLLVAFYVYSGSAMYKYAKRHGINVVTMPQQKDGSSSSLKSSRKTHPHTKHSEVPSLDKKGEALNDAVISVNSSAPDKLRENVDQHVWRNLAKDESTYDVHPEAYKTEYENNEVFDEAKGEWRSDVERGDEFGLDPDDYETEEEYLEVLNKEKYGWRDSAEDDLEYGLSPDDYETEEEYEEALNDAKYDWRNHVENDYEHSVCVDDYETKEEYEQALNEAKELWRSLCDENHYGIDPEDYDSEYDYEAAVEEASYDEW